MKKFALCLLVCWAAGLVSAQEEGWLTDLAKAKAEAKSEKKMVLMDFNGSDWCPPCKALRKNVLNSPEFKEYAAKNLILVDVDFPKTKAQSEEQKAANRKLAEEYKVEGYPTVVVLSSDGKELKKSVGYGGQSAKEFIAELEKAKSKS